MSRDDRTFADRFAKLYAEKAQRAGDLRPYGELVLEGMMTHLRENQYVGLQGVDDRGDARVQKNRSESMQYARDLLARGSMAPEKKRYDEIRRTQGEQAADAYMYELANKYFQFLEYGSGGGKPPTVTTQQEFDRLPSGASFIEDGVEYVKP
jgi:hypothetical protein